MAKTDLKLNATNGYGDDFSTTISYVNPDAGKNEILAFTQALNALTTNTYKETQRIQTVNVDLETVPTTPTLTASMTTFSAAEFITEGVNFRKSGSASILTYNGDGDFVVEKAAILANLYLDVRAAEGKVIFFPFYNTNSAPTFPLTFNVGFTETDNYKACSVEITITA